MYEVASFNNFCNASEHFLLALLNKPLAESQARIIESYCKEILAMLPSSLMTSNVEVPCQMPDDSSADCTSS